MSGDSLAIFAFAMVFLMIFVLCAKCCESICHDDAVPAYSAPIVVTSQSHQAPGSNRTQTVLNQNSRPPGQFTPSSYPIGTIVNGSSAPHSPKNTSRPYPPQASYPPTGSYPPQSSYPPPSSYPPQSQYSSQPAYNPQQMPLPSNMPYPPATSYSPQIRSNSPQIRSNSPHGPNMHQPSAPPPSAPYPMNYSSEDLDVPPNYEEAMTNFSKEQKKM